LPTNVTKIDLAQLNKAPEYNKDTIPRSFKDCPDQRQFNLISTIAKNKKI